MRDTTIAENDTLDIRADETAMVEVPLQGYRNILLMSDEDFTKDKDAKLRLRRQRRREKLSSRW